MNFDEIVRILELVREHDLAEFELELEGLKLRVRTSGGQAQHTVQQTSTAPVHFVPPVAPVSMAALPASAPATGEVIDETELELAVVKSPIVGTFYRSSEPGSAPFVDIGQQVKKDQVLCIIEAMKLMNEITSEYEGEIVSVYVENGKPVQYGERLFAIKTSA
jgi:acetyl-CoA carboxylase biotin carboxyl carrier protein